MARSGATDMRKAGELLFGSHWQRPLAERVGLSDRQLRRYLAKIHPVSTSVMQRLYDMLGAQSEEIAKLRGQIKERYL